MARSRVPQGGKRVRGLRRAPRPPAAPRMGRLARARTHEIPPWVLSALQDYVDKLRDERSIPGMAYAIVQDDTTVVTRCIGCLRADKETGQCAEITPLVNEDTVFQIGSITKSFTATQLAHLVYKQQLAWSDRISQYLEDFRLYEPWATQEFQVSDIMAHRSGLPEYCLALMEILGFGRDEIIRALRHVEPVESFRSAYAYQNAVPNLAGKLIEERTGLTWNEHLARRLLKPLGMSRTTADPKVVAQWENVATGHRFEPPTVEPGKGRAYPIDDDWPYADSLYATAPSGAIHSSVSDMVRWMRFHLGRGKGLDGGRLINEEDMAYLHTPRTAMGFILPAFALSYAAGWVHNSMAPAPLLFHNGGTVGMNASLGLIPDERTGIVVLTNLEPEPLGPEVGDAASLIVAMFCALYLGGEEERGRAAALGPLPRERPLFSVSRPVRVRGKQPEPSPSSLRGAFVNPAYGRFELRLQGPRPVLVMGPRPIIAPVEHIGGCEFSALIPDSWGTRLYFAVVLDGARRIKELQFHGAFEDVLRGRFIRESRGRMEGLLRGGG